MSNCRSRFAVQFTLFALSVLFLLGALPAYAGRAPINTALTLSASELAQGTAVTLTANVTSDGDSVYPGTVNFYDSYGLDANLLIGTAQLNTSGSSSIVRTLGPGTHSLVAKFAGYNGSASSTSSAQSLKVDRATYPSITTLTDSGVPGNYSLTAIVSGAGPNAPSGSISFNDTTFSNLLGGAGLGSPTVTTGFSAPNALASGSEPVGIATGDLNGDGKMDIVVTNYQSGSVSVFLGNGDGTFQTAQTVTMSNTYSVALVLADFNNDGKLDMAVTAENGGLSILLGNGDGTFQAPTILEPESETYGIVAGDFNGDGNVDLAVATWDGEDGVTILLGNGDGTFQAPINTGQYAELLAVGDFNNDGKLDLALTSEDSGTVIVMLGNGDGTFQPAQSYAVGSDPYYVATGDFNGDGKLDLVVSNLEDSTVSVLLGNGDGTFNTQVAYPAGSEGAGVQVVDINADGKPDLVVADVASSSVSLLLGNGDGTFQAPSSYPAGAEAYLSAVADFNGDGALDMAISDIGANSISVLLNSTGWTATAAISGVAVSGNGNNHNVTASYSGDTLYTASTSTPVVLIGNSTATVASLAVSSTSITYGGSVQLTGSIAPYSSGNYVATGSLTFYDGTNQLATVAITNGQAGYTASSLAVGAHNYTVVYSGDANFVQSTSDVTTVNVTADFSLGASSSTPGATSSTVMPGGTAVYVLQFSPIGSSTFPNTVALALTGLPAGATYTVSPSSITAGSGTTAVTITVNTAKQQSTTAATRPHLPTFAYAMLVPLFGMIRLRRTLRARMKSCLPVLLVLAVALVMATAACGNGSGFFSQAPQSYPMTLTGTSGALHHSVALNLTVQ